MSSGMSSGTGPGTGPGANSDEGNHFEKCSVCKKPIPWGGRYYKCSVSTCNRQRFQLQFCSVECWDAHIPGQRHRSAYATEQKAPPKS